MFLRELPLDEMEVDGRLGRAASVYSDFESDLDWDDYSQDWESADHSFDQEFEPDPVSSDETYDVGTGTASRFFTAAEMADADVDAPACSPDAFRQGMIVVHPQYGLGKIVSLGGRGTKRSATVQFTSENATRSFRLAYSPLRPVADSNEGA
jgi:DNA helicase-2/ATP-dependent DNA helicase PcrA